MQGSPCVGVKLGSRYRGLMVSRSCRLQRSSKDRAFGNSGLRLGVVRESPPNAYRMETSGLQEWILLTIEATIPHDLGEDRHGSGLRGAP